MRLWLLAMPDTHSDIFSFLIRGAEVVPTQASANTAHVFQSRLKSAAPTMYKQAESSETTAP